MLKTRHVEPFLVSSEGRLRVRGLAEAAASSPALIPFLDRLCRLVRRLEGRTRAEVAEALRRQERRVRDAARLRGLARTLLDGSRFEAPAGAAGAPAIRDELFRAAGAEWPPADPARPYRIAAAALGLEPDDIDRLLYADRPDRRLLVRAPSWQGSDLMARYDFELARAVLIQAESLRFQARGGWKATFRALKLARLMVEVQRTGRRTYQVEVTGPASPYLQRPQRYGVRFARALPALLGAPHARIDARVHHRGRVWDYRVEASEHPVVKGRRRRYDSRWEESLARVLRDKIGDQRAGWTLIREDAPLVLAEGRVFLPDFTLRHDDGREALVELVGYWTPEYLHAKLAKVREAGLSNLVLVVSRALGEGAEAFEAEAPVVWFTERPSAGPVLEVAARVARAPSVP